MRKPTSHKAKDGTISYKVRFRNSTRQQTSQTFDAKQEADRFCHLLYALGPAAALHEISEPDDDVEALTLDEWAGRYLDSLTGVTPGTRITYERIYRNKWQPRFGSLPLVRVEREAIRRQVNVLSQRYADKTVRNAHGLLAGMLESAVLDGHLPVSPCKGVRLPRRTEHETNDLQFLTHDQFSRLIAEIPEHYRPLFITLVGTGMRWGEVEVLTVGDVQLEAATVRVNKAAKADPSKATKDIGPTKTPRSNRTVTLPPEVVTVLAPLVEVRRRDERLFLAPRGGPLRHRTVYDGWRPATVRAGLNGLTIRSLRHTHVSWLIAAGIPLPVIQARLGHENITTTIDTYGHLLPDLQRAAAQAASRAFHSAPVSDA